MGKKLFVLDTNVILHDFNCVNSFDDNDVAIPITVLEEMDRFKTGHNQINYNARMFTRILDGLSGDKHQPGSLHSGFEIWGYHVSIHNDVPSHHHGSNTPVYGICCRACR